MKKSFYIQGLCGAIILLGSCRQAGAQGGSERIRINQLGYYPYAPKTAIVVGVKDAVAFYIIAEGTGDTVYRGHAEAALHSANSSLETQCLRFNGLQRTGRYRITVPGAGSSFSFHIQKSIQQPAAKAVLKGYYYMRASMPLEAAYAGKWARPAGHPDTAVLVHASAATTQRPAGTVIACPGGWYDAGDYNKYVVNSGISMGTLLSAYEDFPAYFDTLSANIPESYDRIPDILNEVLYNLRWMLTMQDPYDGGVYNKCTNAAFDGMVMPGVTRLPRYVVEKGTAATLDFAAVMAQAARICRKFERALPGLSDSCLRAARHAWQWAQRYPALEYNQNMMNAQYTPRISTGGYGDRRFTDEWTWAACELYATTKEKAYDTVVAGRLNDSLSLPSWGNVGLLGYYTLLRLEKQLPMNNAGLKKRLVAFADRLLAGVNGNAFKTVMGGRPNDFNWGSNANAANQAIVLINAWFITNDPKYIDNALTNLDYLLGRNATGYCFVTGIGSRSTRHPHHRPSVADGIDDPVPGLLAGGPNPGRQDHCPYDFTEPETAYSDTDCSYASNEVAINWNAPLVYLANAIEALQYRVGYSVQAADSLRYYPANHSLIRYTGRIDFSNPLAPRCWSPGVYMEATFTGGDCAIIINDEELYGFHNYIEVVVDGQARRLQTTGKSNTLTVAEGLGEGTHTLLVCKNTESNIGFVEFAGIRCRKLVKLPPAPVRRIEFIGNSITCGASSDLSGIPCGAGKWHDQHNAYMAYGPRIARELRAQWHLTSVSGIGLMHSCCKLEILMPQVFDKVQLRTDSIAWDFKKYQPDVLTVCLGQNDGVQDSAVFCARYTSFLGSLRKVYPGATILCLSSPMADSTLNAVLQRYLPAIVSGAHQRGDKKIYSFFYAKRYYHGCDTHPDLAEHGEMAKELGAYIKRLMHW